MGNTRRREALLKACMGSAWRRGLLRSTQQSDLRGTARGRRQAQCTSEPFARAQRVRENFSPAGQGPLLLQTGLTAPVRQGELQVNTLSEHSLTSRVGVPPDAGDGALHPEEEGGSSHYQAGQRDIGAESISNDGEFACKASEALSLLVDELGKRGAEKRARADGEQQYNQHGMQIQEGRHLANLYEQVRREQADGWFGPFGCLLSSARPRSEQYARQCFYSRAAKTPQLRVIIRLGDSIPISQLQRLAHEGCVRERRSVVRAPDPRA
ncbi:hypothetical protein cyc_01088 [Cyclospora cayetanensis]|uniref:Uncharacterized protein n=1 Tax=Cyclospora cayetanensis TaxID=88456 RepID=A0A1D3D3C1_9EIME|nr:hypothetical protein cyc_01088 [Cyclospora cayetanensis]